MLRPSTLAVAAVSLFSALAASAPATGAPQPASFIADGSESYVFNLSWGAYGNLNDEFYNPEAAALDKAGNLWVADQNNHRVLKFDADGNFLFSFGAYGSADGQFNAPRGIAIDTQRNTIWVSDASNNRVQKFNLSGEFVCKNATVVGPRGLSVNLATGDVYVANGNVISRIGASCGSKTSWGGAGTGNGEFNAPADTAVDGAGNVWVTDSNNNRVQKFSAAGAFIAAYGVYGSGDSRFSASPQFSTPWGIDIDAAGDIYISDVGNDRIQKFRPNFAFVTAFGWGGYGPGQFDYAYGVAVDGRGRVYVVDRNQNRIDRFAPSPSALTRLFKATWGTSGSGDGQFSAPGGIALNPATGKVYVADFNNNRVQVFTAAGAFDSKFGSGGAGDGQFSGPNQIAIDPSSGAVYVTDYYNHRVQKFDAAGAFVTKWGSNGSASGQFSYPSGIAVDPGSGDVYVVDAGNHRVQRFTSAGVFVRGIGNGTTWTGAAPAPAAGNGNSWFNNPTGVAVNAAGQVFVGEYYNHRVQRFSGSGAFQTRWGAYGGGFGQFDYPQGIALDAAGNVFVADSSNHRLQTFKPDGRFVGAWSSYGTGDGQVNYPTALGIGSGSGPAIYVADRSNNRINRYETFGFTEAVAPASRTITRGASTTFTVTLSGVGPNTLGINVALKVLSGQPNASTLTFAPATLSPSGGGTVSSTLTVATTASTAAKTYTLAIEAVGGGQTRVKTVTLNVNP